LKNLIVTIDGPAASGKEKIAKYISKKWKLKHLDSGILYRRLAFNFLINNVEIDNINQCILDLSEEFDEFEIRLYRIKFLSDLAN